MDDRYPHLPTFERKMKSHGLAPVVVETFAHYYRQIVDGETGVIPDEAIRPLEQGEVIAGEDLDRWSEAGKRVRDRAVRITLNGGLGTSMGLTGPKSLLEVKDGMTFLDIILRQSGVEGVRQVFMNSFSTDVDTRRAVDRLATSPPPDYFIQNKFPKILHDGFAPATWPEDPEKEWNPPGHGDLYTAIHATGTLDRLLDQGVRYAFIHNSDNLGATLDPSLLGFFAENRLPFMMEAARRNPADFKGGHLAVRRSDGQLLLRESAQCPPGTKGTDVNYYRYFNTNNLWIDLNRLKSLIMNEKTIQLPLIVNPKTLDPRDGNSPRVLQVETAVGAAIELFKGARAVVVPRGRFFPVKKCNDLLLIRSDRYRLTPDHRVESCDSAAEEPPCIELDSDYYGRIDRFDDRFPAGAPSLKACQRLTIHGDIRFGADIQISGEVKLTNRSGAQVSIPDGTRIERDMEW
ncbi:MAG: UTP--glucose-1-phosphate uridylyltransferase [Desulfobacterales bacterium]